MRIVVTGASGQLGSHLLERLTEDPHEVFAWSGSRREWAGTSRSGRLI